MVNKHPILQRLEDHGWQTKGTQTTHSGHLGHTPTGPVPTGRAAAYGQAVFDAEYNRVAAAVNGTRNDTLNRAAFALGTISHAVGMDEHFITEELLDAARKAGLDDTEAAATIQSGLTAGMSNPRGIPDKQDQAPAHTVAPDDTDPLDVEIFAGDWLDQQSFPPLQWTVHRVLAEGLGVLAGAPKVGKSWFVLAVALMKASGGPALGCIDTKPGPVLYLALEDGKRRLQDRARQLLDGKPIPSSIDFVIKGNPIQLEETVRAWLDKHQDANPLVVIDTLQKMRPASSPGVGAYELDYRHVSKLKALADDHPGSTVLLVHHTRKDKGAGDFLEAVSGTFGISGAADYTVVLTRNRQENTGHLAVTGRDVHEAEYQLTNENGNWILTGGSLDAAAAAIRDQPRTEGLGDNSAEIVAWIYDNGSGTTNEIADELGLDREIVRKTLTRAEKAGRIVRLSRGIYGPVPTTSPAATIDPPEQEELTA